MPAITESSIQVVAPAVRESGSAPDRSDEGLVRAIAGGDRRAMQLYGRHHVRVYRFVLRLTNNVSLAEDLVSEVFFDVWKQGAGFEGRSQVSTWILAIARNKALSALRRRRDEQLDDDVANSVEDPADNAQTTRRQGSKSRTATQSFGNACRSYRAITARCLTSSTTKKRASMRSPKSSRCRRTL